jgi:alkanesulfonate monooxygenase SsuD/methylene tetrahydromethanopterin reductase-like flavin-dependent oxidoreductase (luciferase family)
VRLSLNITDFSSSQGPVGIGAWLARIARAADESGLDTLWVSDHLLQADPNSSLDAPMLEAYTTLGFLAAQTQRIRLGTMVTAVTYRPAALLVKAVTTLDVLSGGRPGSGSEPDTTRGRRPRWAYRFPP